MINREKKTAVILTLVVMLGLTGCSENGLWSLLPEELAETVERVTGSVEDTQEAVQPALIQEVEQVSSGNYAYENLDEETKLVYDEVYSCLQNQEEKISVATENTDVLDCAYQSVLADYGEIFWVSGYVYTVYTRGDEFVGLEFAPKYTMTLEERKNIQLLIDQEVDEILLGISLDASDYEKAKYVFEYLATNVDYAIGSDENQNIISVFLNHVTVCQGYACATQYLLERLGIPCVIVTGEANNEAHAWNLALLDGAYYYIDTTWGNSTYQGGQTGASRYVNYNYFCVTTEELTQTHLLGDLFLLPECTATENNYYVKEGLYFTEFQPETIGEVLRDSYTNGAGSISFKFGTPELYASMKQYFIQEQHIADYCTGISTVYYIEDNQQNVMTINFY